MKAMIKGPSEAASVELPADVLDALGVKPGETVELSIEAGRVILAARPAKTLEDLVAEMKGQARPEVVDWGPPVGHEVW